MWFAISTAKKKLVAKSGLSFYLEMLEVSASNYVVEQSGHCELHLYPDQAHVFFNIKKTTRPCSQPLSFNFSWLHKTMKPRECVFSDTLIGAALPFYPFTIKVNDFTWVFLFSFLIDTST